MHHCYCAVIRRTFYWPVRNDMLEKVKLAFDANGISIPSRQQDVYMHNAA
jgi:small conductance mechanosensitive channel